MAPCHIWGSLCAAGGSFAAGGFPYFVLSSHSGNSSTLALVSLICCVLEGTHPGFWWFFGVFLCFLVFFLVRFYHFAHFSPSHLFSQRHQQGQALPKPPSDKICAYGKTFLGIFLFVLVGRRCCLLCVVPYLDGGCVCFPCV